MALSDLLHEAGQEIESGADIYEQSCLISDNYISWVRQLGELCKHAADCIQKCETLPPLPELASGNFDERSIRPAVARRKQAR